MNRTRLAFSAATCSRGSWEISSANALNRNMGRHRGSVVAVPVVYEPARERPDVLTSADVPRGTVRPLAPKGARERAIMFVRVPKGAKGCQRVPTGTL